MKTLSALFACCCMTFYLVAQTEIDSMTNTNPSDHYYNIPSHAEDYSAGSIASRMVDGLAFRYYWATANLTEEDLAYKPNDDARTMYETIGHIFNLSRTTSNAIHQVVNVRGQQEVVEGFDNLRSRTLEYLKSASETLRNSSEEDLKNYNMIFQRDENRSEYPFWNLVNGPISDAIWHVGQVVSFRRSAGNPFPEGVSVLRGTKRN